MMDARQVRFWIAAFAITAINVTLWISSHQGGELSGLVRVAHASTGDELAETGRLSLRFDREGEVIGYDRIVEPGVTKRNCVSPCCSHILDTEVFDIGDYIILSP